MTKPKDLYARTLQPCFYVGHAMYIPHVKFYKCWATYAGGYKTLEELQSLGAVLKYEKIAPQVAPNDWISKMRLA
jgi:hypothetical protein